MSYITVSNLSKRFVTRGQWTQALSNIDLDIEQGSFVSFIGPSGCGKSTLLRIIGGLMDSEEGDIEVGGRTPLEMQADKQFGFVPQAPALFPWRTVLQNMNIPFEVNRRSKTDRAEEKGEPIELLQAVGLGDFIHAYPKELSGGMKQRVGIVRAFASGAPILLMDEPFSALDEITREKLMYQLVKIWDKHNKTVIFVTHNIQEAVYLSDKVVIMSSRPGRISKAVDIHLPRPRAEGIIETPEFHQYVLQLRECLRERW
ncbi:ABC transporter ATP-binding protein [Paenibacillus sp. S150]|uniref:ABC transporter ATP-binding protein n=1 Tax=Paenibacillus sp. S150 TaxID=2749826 RepID=UPI001C567F96|nr:ATP-binding cassette domain-containing protein [Paenibacillus sp. S150]MBW4079804.1 ABC transporter ATP-binding protein [Paenibacillus sp. S150]